MEFGVGVLFMRAFFHAFEFNVVIWGCGVNGEGVYVCVRGLF